MKRTGRLDRGRARGSHRTVVDELEWAEAVTKAYERSGWTQLQAAKSLGISKAAVCQALTTSRLDPRIKEAMVAKAKTGWRARQEDARRFAQAPVEKVLLELAG